MKKAMAYMHMFVIFLLSSLDVNHRDAKKRHAKKRKNKDSAAGNWARVFRVTGGNTNHYTTADWRGGWNLAYIYRRHAAAFKDSLKCTLIANSCEFCTCSHQSQIIMPSKPFLRKGRPTAGKQESSAFDKSGNMGRTIFWQRWAGPWETSLTFVYVHQKGDTYCWSSYNPYLHR